MQSELWDLEVFLDKCYHQLSQLGYSSEDVPQLHRLASNAMKLPEFVGLVNVSIAVDLKSFKNLAKRSKSGRQFRVSQ